MSASLTRAMPASQSAFCFLGHMQEDRAWAELSRQVLDLPHPHKELWLPGPRGSTAKVDYELGVPYNIYSTKQAGSRGNKVSHQLNQRSHFRGIVCSMLLRKPHAAGSHQSAISVPDHKSTTA